MHPNWKKSYCGSCTMIRLALAGKDPSLICALEPPRTQIFLGPQGPVTVAEIYTRVTVDTLACSHYQFDPQGTESSRAS